MFYKDKNHSEKELNQKAILRKGDVLPCHSLGIVSHIVNLLMCFRNPILVSAYPLCKSSQVFHCHNFLKSKRHAFSMIYTLYTISILHV